MRLSNALLSLFLAMLGTTLIAGDLAAQRLREAPVMSTAVIVILVVLLVAVVGFFILRRTRGRS